MKQIKCTLLKIAFFIMAINLNSNVFANNLPVKKSTVSYPVNRDEALSFFQNRVKSGQISNDMNVDATTFYQKIGSNLELMTGKEFSPEVVKGMLLSKKVYTKQISASELWNSYATGGALYDFDMQKTNAGKMVWCLMIVFEGNEYPLIKFEGTYGVCLNPVRFKKAKDPYVPDVTWSMSGKSRCNNGVSEVEKISSDGQSVWVPGGNACPPPCSTDFKLVDTQVFSGTYADTIWYKWENGCGEIKYTFQPSTKPITKVDGPCNCPKVVDVVKNKKVYNRYPAFVPQAPYLPQGQMVYVNQQPRIIYQNILSPNRGGPSSGNPLPNGDPSSGNPSVPTTIVNNSNGNGINANPGNNGYVFVNGQWVPSSGNPGGYYTNPFFGNNTTPTNPPGPGYIYVNGQWVPSGGNPGTGTGNPISG